MTIDTALTEKAVEYLRASAEKYGNARGYQAFCDANLRRVKAMRMLADESEDTMGMKEARAYASVEYHNAITELQNATADVETLRAKRDAAELTIEVWRSLSSAAKQGINVG